MRRKHKINRLAMNFNRLAMKIIYSNNNETVIQKLDLKGK
jgi:hypothetical protein